MHSGLYDDTLGLAVKVMMCLFSAGIGGQVCSS